MNNKINMKIFNYLLPFVFLFASCNNNSIPQKYKELVVESLSKSGDNRVELEKALDFFKGEKKEAISFLIAYMPEHDLKTLSS